MIAWMAARCDGPHYGKLIAYNFPKQKLIYGPRQIDARIDQDAFISQQLSLWSQRGSQVIRGSLLAIPIEQSLLYVQPLYLAAEKGSLPELKRVIVSLGNQIAMEENLEASLAQIFGGPGQSSQAVARARRRPARRERPRTRNASAASRIRRCSSTGGLRICFARGISRATARRSSGWKATLKALRERAR